MINKGDKEIIAGYIGTKLLSYIYKGALLIWQSVRSCFGSGYWVNEKPWLNDESWKNDN